MKLTEQQREQIQALGLSRIESEEILKYLSNQRKVSIFFDKENNLLKSKEELSTLTTLYNERMRKQEEAETKSKEERREAKREKRFKEERDNIVAEEPKGEINSILKDVLNNCYKDDFNPTEEEIFQTEKFCGAILNALHYAQDKQIREQIKELEKKIEDNKIELQTKIEEDTKKVEELKQLLKDRAEH